MQDTKGGRPPDPGKRRGPLPVLAAAGLYFGTVFGCGFVFGVLRTLFLVPRVGERWAELLELPWMVFVVVLAARWVLRLFELTAAGPALRLAIGGTALLLLMAAEVGIVLGLRGLTLAEYIADRDPVSGTAYAVSLLIFALMPLLLTPRPPFGGRP